MKVVLSIYHPAYAHQFRFVVDALKSEGHDVKVFAVKKDNNLLLLEQFGIPYRLLANSTGKGTLQKAFMLFYVTFKTIAGLWGYKPDVFIGTASPMMALAALFYRRPYIVFEDTEHSTISITFCKWFATVILTSTSFRTHLGEKQKRLPVYKESFYVHPETFTPNEDILKDLGVEKGEAYILMRFVSWQASHDLFHTGLTDKTKRRALEEFKKFGKVFISSEDPLPEYFEAYRIKIPFEKIHSVLYYATLVYGESATMAAEGGVLGTHAIFSDFEGRGYTDDLEARFDLVSNFKLDEESQIQSVNRGVELLSQKNLWQTGKEKRKKMLLHIENGTSAFLKEMHLTLQKKQ